MKRIVLTLVITLVVLFTAGFAQGPQPRTNWEYKFDSKCSEKRSNELAIQGWELTAVSAEAFGSVSVMTCVFKRPR